MFQIPQYVLEKLRCSICGSYLSTKPLMLRVEDQQICGKCYKLLPTEEKDKCVRQIGLESIAELIQFPCRYNNQGCKHTYNWCDDKDHEATCPYMNLISFPGDSNNVYARLQHKNEITCNSDQIKSVLTYDIKENAYNNETKILKYSLHIKGNCDKSLVIRNNDTATTTEDIQIEMEGNILLGVKPELIYSDIKIKPIEYTNLYETLSNYKEKCSKCGDSNSGNLCLDCVKTLDRDSKTVCKNYQKGCKETLQVDSAHRHEVNCQFNDYKCIIEPCNVISTLPNIKQHIKADHSSEIYLSNEINRQFGKKDETIVILVHGGIFKCVYYNYKSFVEFYVTFVGSSEDAANYCYEISVNLNGKVLKKRSKCSSWNDSMLERGVSFDKNELIGEHDKRLNFFVNLKIINVYN